MLRSMAHHLARTLPDPLPSQPPLPYPPFSVSPPCSPPPPHSPPYTPLSVSPIHMLRSMAHQLARTLPELQSYYGNLDQVRVSKLTQV